MRIRLVHLESALAAGLLSAAIASTPLAEGMADTQGTASHLDNAAQQAEQSSESAAVDSDSMQSERNSDIRVAEVRICEKIDSRTPVGSHDSFAADVNNLYCFTDVRDAGASQRIFHRWYVGDELVCEVPMDVQGSRWRCWSEKTIWPKWSGPCRVEVVTEEGEQIAQASFTLVDVADRDAESASQAGSDPVDRTDMDTMEGDASP